MPQLYKYDLVIIGGGPGGYVAAIRAAQLGGKVALVEKERIGGTCLNRGCIPTKTLVHSAEVYLAAKEPEKSGVEVEGQVKPNFARMMARKNEVLNTLVEQVIRLMESHGIDIYDGVGTILNPGMVRVKMSSGFQDLPSSRIIVASGSVPAIPPIPGVDLPGVLTSRQLLELEELPKSLVIIGGSTIGLEFACIFNALGTSVSVVGRRTFLKRADQSLAKRFRPILARRGVKVVIGLDFKEIIPTDGKLRLVYEIKGKEEYVEGEKVLLATGRWPYTDDLGVEGLGIKMKGRAILVNEYMETNVPGIYAIGDVLGTT
ncbi:MAG: NAD(P)/FAD-dependent oxidoreductase [Anaerolineae bacterium]